MALAVNSCPKFRNKAVLPPPHTPRKHNQNSMSQFKVHAISNRCVGEVTQRACVCFSEAVITCVYSDVMESAGPALCKGSSVFLG